MQHHCRGLVFLTAALLYAVPLCSADLAFNCTTPKSSTDRSKANTFVGLSGSQIATSLLEAGTPAMLWGLVPSSSVGESRGILSARLRPSRSGWNSNPPSVLQAAQPAKHNASPRCCSAARLQASL